ncbi:MAG TPA: tyrosine-type recombinase/integrase, partial [Ottowia sp.]|nr:tyrosine-type recombinase/integrase [Ottowia sp.]
MSNDGAPPLDAAPADAALVERYLEHVRVERRLAARTVTLYSLDLEKLSDFAAAAGIGLRAVQPAHVRRWVAQMHAGGRSGRGIALVLSGWRGFYAWLGREGRVAANPVQDVRAPRQPRPLPKALGVDDAVRLADFHAEGEATDPWLEARDAALVELLYGSGLRVGEVVGLDAVASDAALRAGRGWIDLPAAEVQVQGKGGKRRTVPLGQAALAALAQRLAVRGQCPQAARAQGALFIGRHGTRLTAQSIWQRLRRRSLQAGLATPAHPHMLR